MLEASEIYASIQQQHKDALKESWFAMMYNCKSPHEPFLDVVILPDIHLKRFPSCVLTSSGLHVSYSMIHQIFGNLLHFSKTCVSWIFYLSSSENTL